MKKETKDLQQTAVSKVTGKVKDNVTKHLHGKYDVVDRETGEIVDQLNVFSTLKSKRRKKRVLDQFAAMVFDKVHTAIKNNELDVYEIAVLMYCISRITYQNNWVSDENGSKLSIFQLEKATGLNRRTLKENLISLQDKGFISLQPIDKKSDGVVVLTDVAWRGTVESYT